MPSSLMAGDRQDPQARNCTEARGAPPADLDSIRQSATVAAERIAEYLAVAHYMITRSSEDPSDIRFWRFDSAEHLLEVEEQLGGMHPDYEPMASFEVRDGRVQEAETGDELVALSGIES